MPNRYTINHPAMKLSDCLLLADGTFYFGMFPAGKVTQWIKNVLIQYFLNKYLLIDPMCTAATRRADRPTKVTQWIQKL